MKKALEYNCPSHGGCGMVRMGMMVPESWQLFVCPSACGRHGALGAIQHGYKDRLFYLFLDDSDIISGYDSTIIDGVACVLKKKNRKPRAFLIFVTCIDDLIGTDCDAVIDELQTIYPDIDFCMCHMNPISSDSDSPPFVTMWKNLWSLISYTPAQKENSVNILGAYALKKEDGDLFSVLKILGIDKVNQIQSATSYDAFQRFGAARLNLVMAPASEKGAAAMESKCNIPYMLSPVSYDPDIIEAEYHKLTEKLNQEKLDAIRAFIANQKKKLECFIQETRNCIGSTGIFLDDSALGNPVSLALFLKKNGFHVQGVFLGILDPSDPCFDILRAQDIPVQSVREFTAYNEYRTDTEAISIGLESAYMTGSRHFVSIYQDQGLYGFSGIITMLDFIRQSVKEVPDLKSVIAASGLII